MYCLFVFYGNHRAVSWNVVNGMVGLNLRFKILGTCSGADSVCVRVCVCVCGFDFVEFWFRQNSAGNVLKCNIHVCHVMKLWFKVTLIYFGMYDVRDLTDILVRILYIRNLYCSTASVKQLAFQMEEYIIFRLFVRLICCWFVRHPSPGSQTSVAKYEWISSMQIRTRFNIPVPWLVSFEYSTGFPYSNNSIQWNWTIHLPNDEFT